MQKGHFVKLLMKTDTANLPENVCQVQPSVADEGRVLDEQEVGGVQSGDRLDQNVLHEGKRSSNTIIYTINRNASRQRGQALNMDGNQIKLEGQETEKGEKTVMDS